MMIYKTCTRVQAKHRTGLKSEDEEENNYICNKEMWESIMIVSHLNTTL